MEHEQVKAKLVELRDEMMATAKKLLEEQGKLTPTVFGMKPDGSLIIVGTSFESLYEKREVYRQIGKMLREKHGCVGAVCINEAWYVAPRKRDGESEGEFDRRVRNSPPPSECPDRMECVVALCCTYGWTVGTNYPFRREDEKIVWQEVDHLDAAIEQWLFPAFDEAH